MALTIALLVFIGSSIESRRLTGPNMAPTLNIGDRVLFDMNYHRFGSPFKRGEIVLFYPPTVTLKPGTLDYSFMAVLERAAAPPRLRHSDSSVKRIIGLPGDKIDVHANQGVLVNGVLVVEPYVREKASYEIHELKDMGGALLQGRGVVVPFVDQTQPVIVPPGHLFVLGDNRNNSEDSHLWGFLDQSRVIGKALFVYFPRWQLITTN